jgi:hypothetical protein
MGCLDIEYFTYGSNFIQWLAGYATVTLDSVIEACQLPVGTSAQKAEHVIFMWAHQLAEGIQVNIYTDCKYAFTTIHVYVVLYKERWLIHSEEKVSSIGRK